MLKGVTTVYQVFFRQVCVKEVASTAPCQRNPRTGPVRNSSDYFGTTRTPPLLALCKPFCLNCKEGSNSRTFCSNVVRSGAIVLSSYCSRLNKPFEMYALFCDCCSNNIDVEFCLCRNAKRLL